MDLIGKKVRGFKFKSTPKLTYVTLMDKQIGKIGTIIDQSVVNNQVEIQFESGRAWYYPTHLVKQHLVDDEFVLPEKWAVRPKFGKEGAAVLEWFNTNGERHYERGGEDQYYWHFPAYENRNHCLMDRIINSDYVEITFEQFETHVLNRKPIKEEKMENTIRVYKSDLEKIHAVACDMWKKKIIELANRTPFRNEVELTQTEVDEMFKAATSSQRTVLVNIFGEPKKPIDFDRIKTASKVMITRSGNHCSGFDNIDASRPVNVIFYKTPYYINPTNWVFKPEGLYSSYCTFEQGGNFVLFSAHKEIDFITEVIEY